jgi:hypothetical protein
MPKYGTSARSTSRSRVTWASDAAGVARPVREEQRIGVQRENVLGGDVLREDENVEAALGQVVHRRRLDPEVEDGDTADPVTLRGHLVRVDRRHVAGEVPARHRRSLADLVELVSLGEVEELAGEDPGAHRAGRADVTGDGPGVDVADPDDAAASRSSSRLRWERKFETTREGSRTTNPATQMRADSMSSSFMPVLPMCGAVIMTIWPAYDGSVRVSW